MPFYEYKRQDGTTFEIMQRMVDPPLECDPETGLPVTRVFHPIAVHFKGKGFYNTDYGTKKRARENDAAESAKKQDDKSSGDAKGEQKSDSSKAETSSSSSSDSSSSDSSSSSSSSESSSDAASSKPAKS